MLTKDSIKFEDESKDILIIKLSKYKLELIAIRNEETLKQKTNQIILELVQYSSELIEKNKQKDLTITKLTKELDQIRSNPIHEEEPIQDREETSKKEKKRKQPKSLVNPSQKRVKPTGSKIL